MRLTLFTYEDLITLAKAVLSQATGVDYPLTPGTLHGALASVAALFGASASAQTLNLVRGSSLEGTTGTLLDRRGLEEGVPRAKSAPARATGRIIPLTSPAPAAYTAVQGTTVIRPATATQSEIAYTLEAAAIVPLGGSQSNLVSIVCTDRGTRGNGITAGTSLELKYAISGLSHFLLASDTGGGLLKQEDPAYRTDIRGARKSNAEGSWAGIENLLKTVKLDSNNRVTVARVFEDFVNQISYAIIDDSSGVSANVGPVDTTTYDIVGFPGATYWSYMASGGEIYVQLPSYHLPYWNAGVNAEVYHWDGVGWTTLTHNTDYFVDIDSGKIAFAAALGVGDQLRVWFHFYTGLVGLAARYMNGVRGSATERGWRPCGQPIRIRGPYTRVSPTVSADLHFSEGFDSEFGRELASTLILTYLNGLDIGEACRYSVCNGILFKVPGVSLVENLLLDGGTVDVPVTNPYGCVRGDATNISI